MTNFDNLAWNTVALLLSFGDTGGLYNIWGVNYDAVIESLSPMISVLFSIAMYLNGIINMHKVYTSRFPQPIKEILLFIKNDATYYMNRPENVILRYYQLEGRKVLIYYASYVYVALLVYMATPGIPLLIGLVSSSNYSHEKTFLYELEYGVDKEKYYYYISLHSYTATTVVANLIASCDTAYMFYAHHAYALFAIVSYQLKTVHIADTSKLIDVTDSRLLEEYGNVELLPREREKIYNKLLDCIKGHQNAIKYTNLIESLFSKSLLVQLFLNVLCLTITGVETVMKMDNIGDLMRFGTFALSQTVHIFFLCLPGQKLVNHSEQMYTAACEVMWYVLPKKCHHLYIFLLTRALIPSKMTAYNLASMTMETFLSIIQTAMSYFTVLLSTT